MTAIMMLLFAAVFDEYKDAHAAYEAGFPMVVVVGFDGCPGCKDQNDTMLELEREGFLKEVSYVYLDIDHKTANRIKQKGKPYPQIFLFWKDGDEEKTKLKIGAMSKAETKRWIEPNRKQVNVCVTELWEVYDYDYDYPHEGGSYCELTVWAWNVETKHSLNNGVVGWRYVGYIELARILSYDDENEEQSSWWCGGGKSGTTKSAEDSLCSLLSANGVDHYKVTWR